MDETSFMCMVGAGRFLWSQKEEKSNRMFTGHGSGLIDWQKAFTNDVSKESL